MLRKPVALLAASLLALPAFAGGPDEPAAKPAASPLDRIKALAGEWTGKEDMHGQMTDITAVYRVVSAGSAVEERLFPGSPHEMVTMFHMDNGALVATHYCALGNQPRMKCTSFDDAKVLKFSFVDCTNMKSPDEMRMGSLVIDVQDADHATWTWTSQEKGKDLEHAQFKLTRTAGSADAGAAAAKMDPSKWKEELATFYLVELVHGEKYSTDDTPETKQIFQGHMAHIEELAKSGKCLAAGPYGDHTGGLLIMKAASEDEARKLAEEDPAVKAGCLAVKVKPWMCSPAVFTSCAAECH